MKRLKELINEINVITVKMEREYPELYKYLDENPVTIPCCKNPELNTKTFSDYLDSLKQLLEHHISSNHPKAPDNVK